MSKLKQTYYKVKSLLEYKEKYRDNDELLVAKYWLIEASAMHLDFDFLPTKQFLIMYKDGKFTPADTILRARRKVNEHFEHTRGKSYKPRKEKQKEIKAELKEIASRA